MKAALHLAQAADADRLDALVAACHAEAGIDMPEADRRAAVHPLLEGSPHGAVYLIGPARAPVGHIVITFGWSLDSGGLDGVVDALYIRPPVRGRGIATEVLLTLPPALAQAGLRALHMKVPGTQEDARRLFGKAGFRETDPYIMMTRLLS